jgi:hypothetical protein
MPGAGVELGIVASERKLLERAGFTPLVGVEARRLL